MVRNLMMILGLSVAVFGCATTDNEGGDGGTGGTPPPSGACTNAADTPLVCASGISEQVGSCATDALGQGPATSTCLQADPGLSMECADCYGDVTQCVYDNCVVSGDGVCGPPNDPDSEGCLSCRGENCDDEFFTCTGEPDCGSGGAGGSAGAGGGGGAGGAGGGGGAGGIEPA